MQSDGVYIARVRKQKLYNVFNVPLNKM